MPAPRRQMALTAELVARAARAVEDAGPSPGAVYLTDAEYDAIVRDTLARGPAGDLWVFGYGSLLWKPGFEFAESRRATVRGWHRSFCIRVARFRGTRDLNGLVMALDRGGQCKGVLFRLPNETLEAQLGRLFRREMPVKPARTPPTNVPRWIAVDAAAEPGQDRGPVRALAFVANPKGGNYAGRLPPEEVADILARACGHGGSCAEYLRNTVSHLEERGIRDRNLWRLQALVAERLASLDVSPGGEESCADTNWRIGQATRSDSLSTPDPERFRWHRDTLSVFAQVRTERLAGGPQPI